jgi:PIN domain nuclease of toxin-antitoxin system
MRLLPIELSHIRSTAALPRHHGDPFDRMLVAQAQAEAAVLVTHDGTLAVYDVPVMRAGA